MMEGMAREDLGRLYKPDPGLRIPNDDPRCQCSLGHEGPVQPGTMVIVSKVDGHDVRVAMREDCVHHGRAIAFIRKGTPSAYSISIQFPPSARRGKP